MDLHPALSRLLEPARVLTRRIDRIAYANDASVYRLVPQAVVRPRSIAEIQSLFVFSRTHRIPLTFRTAGTSLSGQAVTDGILVDVARHWRTLEVERDGAAVRVQPGVIGGVVNRHLKPYGAKIGPDPASIDSCMMGGILANNSSGMCCGVAQNAYRTLESMILVLPDGTVVNSSRADAAAALTRDAPGLVRGLAEIRDRIRGDAALSRKIRTKYTMKNTMGYSLNAFVDFSEPVEILTHLMIGSEGTLGFIAEAVLRTVPDYRHKYTGLLFFPDVSAACRSIAPLRGTGARALELMDRASLRAVQDQPGVPEGIRELPDSASAILVEYQCNEIEELDRQQRHCDELLASLPLISDAVFTRAAEAQAALWRVRKGLIPSVGSVRQRGTSFIIEDVVFPVEHLADGVAELQQLFARFDYNDAIVFGHAKDGNLHFVLTQAFDESRDVDRYDGFMRALAELVTVRHGGALKAEHGTGRNMAPFVETEWGRTAYEVMQDLKQRVDPDRLLNPGVILNEDPQAHVRHLKTLPEVETEVDGCIECGFCEKFCPSRDLTLTPRQRIVVLREITRLAGDRRSTASLRELERDFHYDGLVTCATDGMCATGCPVAIDTGSLVKRFRERSHPEWAQELAAVVEARLPLAERAARGLLWTAGVVRPLLPRAKRDLPDPAGPLPATERAGATAVYFPTCVSRVIGETAELRPLGETVVSVAATAGRPVWIPPDVVGRCCGLPFASKGYERAGGRALIRLIDACWSWSSGGELPIVIDQSPCTHALKQARGAVPRLQADRLERMEILDGTEFAHDRLLSGLNLQPRPESVMLHPTCSIRRMNLQAEFTDLARACVERVATPLSSGCCGFAGDRGFRIPALTAAATATQAREVNARPHDGYYSSSRTCEIGMTRATGKPYRSIWHLLDDSVRLRPPFASDRETRSAGYFEKGTE